MKKRILVVEDDAVLARVLADNLTFEGFEVQHVADGRVAVDAARRMAPDLVLLDLTLPGMSGLELCAIWREEFRTPIIMLTSRTQKADKLLGLRMGADDYVTKPFDLEELMARVHAVLRRARPSIERLRMGTVIIDFLSQKAWNGSELLDLSHREFSLLRYLAERADSVVHRDELLHELWGFPDAPHTRAVDHAIVRLRRKIEVDPHRPQFIRTVYGDGYSLASGAFQEVRGSSSS
jgi:DNA-binding response OmpR family regulator